MIGALHRFVLRLYRRLPRRARRWVVRGIAPKYTVGSMCLIERDDGALLLVRHVYRRRWGVPGGLLARREDPHVAALREADEEIGVAVELVSEPAVVVEPDPQRIDIVYRARLRDPEAVPVPSSAEIAEVAWFARDALPELQRETTTALMAMARASNAPMAPLMRTAEPGPRRSGDDGAEPTVLGLMAEAGEDARGSSHG